MVFTIIVCGNPCTSQSSISAFHFARAVLAKGHTVKCIFFYAGGALNGSAAIANNATDLHLPSAWQRIHHSGVDLQICSGSAVKTGVVDKLQAKHLGVDSGTLAEGFTISGLGSLTEAIIKSDRVITFGTIS